MGICPYCGHDNIEGEDECAECLQPLSFLSTPRPGTPLEKSVLRDRIRLLGAHTPFLVAAGLSVHEALKRMVDRRVGCAMVVDQDEQLVGIFTERDALLRIGAKIEQVDDRPVSEFMTPSPQTIDEDDPIVVALHKMDLGGYRHLPVMHEGRVTGLVSIRDILGYFAERLFETEHA